MIDAIMSGISISKTTSKIIKTGVRTEAFLNSFICAANVLIINNSLLPSIKIRFHCFCFAKSQIYAENTLYPGILNVLLTLLFIK